MMQDWADWALDTAKSRGATYADVRVMDIRHRDLSTKNGQVGNLSESQSLGLGVRALAGGESARLRAGPFQFQREGRAL